LIILFTFYIKNKVFKNQYSFFFVTTADFISIKVQIVQVLFDSSLPGLREGWLFFVYFWRKSLLRGPV